MKFKTLYYYRAGEKKKAVKSREKLANRQPSISTTSLKFLSSMSKPKTQSMHSFRQIPSTFIPNKQPIAFLVVFFIEVFIFCASWMKMMMKNTCCQLANNKHYSPQALPVSWCMKHVFSSYQISQYTYKKSHQRTCHGQQEVHRIIQGFSYLRIVP